MSNPYPSCQGALALYEVTAIYSSMSRTQVLYNDFFALIYKDCMSKLLSYCAQIHPFSKLRDFFGQEVKFSSKADHYCILSFAYRYFNSQN